MIYVLVQSGCLPTREQAWRIIFFSILVFKFLFIAGVWQKSNFLLIKSDLHLDQAGDWLIVDGLLTMLKNLKTALFQTFSTWHRIPSALTALYWPSTAFYWPSTTKYQPVPPPTDPVPPSTNRYHFLLTQCRHISNSTTRYRPSTNKYQPVPPHSVVTRGLQTPAQFTLGLVLGLIRPTEYWRRKVDKIPIRNKKQYTSLIHVKTIVLVLSIWFQLFKFVNPFYFSKIIWDEFSTGHQTITLGL